MRAGWLAPIAAIAWAAFTLGAAPASAQSLGGLYVNSASLQSQVDALDAAAQASKTLQPYDDQLANLATFAQQEDLAVATRDVAARDLEMATLLATPGDKRANALIADACARLKVQAPAADCTKPATLQNYVGVSDKLQEALARAASAADNVSAYVHRIERDFPDQATPSCTNAAAQQSAAPAGSKLFTELDTLINLCGVSKNLDQIADNFKERFPNGADGVSGDPVANLGDTVADAAAADATAQAKALGGGDLTALQAQIDQLQKAASDKTDLGSLEDLEKSIQAALANVDPVLQVAGLDKLQNSLTQLSAGVTCAGATSCQGQQASGVASQSSATVGFLNAIAGVADASAGRGSRAQWLLAAQAIVAAIKADAQLQADADKANAAAADIRFQLSVREVSMLAATVLIAQGQSGAAQDTDLCGGADHFSCALPYYVEGWNSGRIPADILSWRSIQRFRTLTVQRQRLVAQEQRGILLAATATLKAYGDGGIQPGTIAQLLNAAGVIAIAAK